MPLAAQIPTPEYGARRDTVAAHLGEGVLLAYGAAEPMTDEADFHQLPSWNPYHCGGLVLYQDPQAPFPALWKAPGPTM